MNNIIIGTAGHVDHGKTSLIRALTGTDTDRLKEEKQRGITIELGFADLKAPDGSTIGIIDVPGHEKFIRNMLAGIGGIDMVLLVVAADEGVMPQTQEHLDIVRLLNIRRGIIAVTKSDLVDEEWMTLVHADILEAVQSTFLEQAPMIDVSTKTGLGIEALREAVFDMASIPGRRNNDPDLLRMPIDRVFTIEGFGTVVTGTLVEGSVRVGQSVSVYPENKQARVRNVQVHGAMVDQARAGQRTAINLTSIKKEDLQRGQVLAAPDSLHPSRMIDVRLDVLASSARTVENNSRVHLHAGADEVLCKVVLLDRNALGAGESGYAQLRLEQPVALKQGDRFVIRYYSPVETIGGGAVLDAGPRKHRRNDPSVLSALAVRESGDERELMELAVKENSRSFPDITSIAKQMGIAQDEALRYGDEGVESGRLAQLSDRVFIHADFVKETAVHAERILSDYHAKYPLSPGMPREEFRSRIEQSLRIRDARHLERIIERLAEEGSLIWESAFAALTGFSVQYTDAQLEMRDDLLESYRKQAHEPPETDIVLEGCRDRESCRQILAALASEGLLVRLNPAVYMDAATLDAIVASIRQRLASQGTISLGELRDELSTSRKFAMQILEYCDEKKITRMEGDYRVSY